MTMLWLTIGALVLLVLAVFRRAWRCLGHAPLDHLPSMFLVLFAPYAVLPPLAWMLQGGFYFLPGSGRLLQFQPALPEQLRLTALALLVVAGVAVGQWLVRCLPGVSVADRAKVPGRVAMLCIGLIIFQSALVAVLQALGIMRQPSSYIETYQVVQELPLGLRQVLKVLVGFAGLAKVIVLTWLFQRWRTQRWWVYLLVAFSLLTLDLAGTRAPLFITLMVCLILWNRYVKPVGLVRLGAAAAIGFVAFTALGTYRGRGTVELAIGGLGEVEVLWANAVELNRAASDGYLQVPPSLRYSEFVGPIPSNILPVEKSTYAEWYLSEYYPDYGLAGGGYMFGVLAQAVISGGLLTPFLRGLALGLFLALLSNRLARGRAWWSYPALVYTAAWMFNTVRDSAFALLTPLVQVTLVGMALLHLCVVLTQTSEPDSEGPTDQAACES